MPVEASRGNGALLLDVPNRGRPISLSLFNSPRNVVVPFGSFDQGIGFLQDAGYTVAAVSWELGHGVELPTFKDAEGTTRYIERYSIRDYPRRSRFPRFRLCRFQ